MLLYEKKDANGVRHIYGTTGNIPSESDTPVIYKDDEGNVLTDITYATRVKDDGHGGMLRVSDNKPVQVWVETTRAIPGGDTPEPGPEVTQIEWETTPTKTTYTVGEAINLAGGKIKATYDDETTEDVTSKSTFEPTNGASATTSMTKVRAKYKKKTADTPITVTEPVVLQSIAFTTEPTTRVYTEGDAISLAGAVVTATYSDASTAVVTNDCTFVPANGDTATVGMTKITATYQNKTADVTIIVNERPLTENYLYYGVSSEAPSSVTGLTPVVKTATQLINNGFSVELTTDDQYSVIAVDNALNVTLTSMKQNGFALSFTTVAAGDQTIYYGDEKSTDTATIDCTFATV